MLNQNYGPYVVSGFTASFTLTGVEVGGETCGSSTNPCPVITLSLGSFNSAKVAATVLMQISNTGDSLPLFGVATLQ